MHIQFFIRLLLVFIFFLSILGKLVDLENSYIVFSKLFNLPYNIAQFITYFVIIIEVGLFLIICINRINRFLLFFPLIFFVVFLYSEFHQIPCGCFGVIPIFNKLNFSQHLLLLFGIFCGFCSLLFHQKKLKEEMQSWLLSLTKCLDVFTIILLIIPFFINWLHYKKNDLFPTVNKVFVESLLSKENTVIVDARLEFQYKIGHIPGAINIYFKTKNLKEFIEQYSLDKKQIIVYCSDSHCNSAILLCKRLQEFGCAKLFIYSEGWRDWNRNLK